MIEKPLEIAVDALLRSLDNTARKDWRQVIIMALHSAKDLGHAEGYRAGSHDLEKSQKTARAANDTGHEEGLAELAGFVSQGAYALPITAPQSEDKALSNDKPSPDEAVEDLGWSFMREIAKQIGVLAIKWDVTPGAVLVDAQTFQQDGVAMAALILKLKNPTL